MRGSCTRCGAVHAPHPSGARICPTDIPWKRRPPLSDDELARRTAIQIMSIGQATSLSPELWAHPGAGQSVVLTWDRAGLDFCAVVFDHRTVGRTYEAARGWEKRARVIDWSGFNREDAA